MPLDFSPMPVPLTRTDTGALRIGKTRISLEWVIHEFRNEGATVQELMATFDTLSEFEVYAVIAYYLANRKAVDEYVQQMADRWDRLANAPEQVARRDEFLRRARERGLRP